MHKIVISRHLSEIASGIDEQHRTSCIPIGIDFTDFKLLTPISERELRIGMLAHPNEAKGTRDGLQALEIVKRKHPQLQVVLFGTEPRLEFIPEWIGYERQPAKDRLVELYNSCRIFLNPSWSEGWGLPAAEAMACGCALVSADNGGVSEFSVDGQSALIVPVKRPDLMADKILALLDDDQSRMRIALSGYQGIQKFTWERAVSSLIEVTSA